MDYHFEEKDLEFICSNGSVQSTRCRLFGAIKGTVVAVMGGISANRQVCKVPDRFVSGGQSPWWTQLIGADRPIDPKKHLILSFDYLPAPSNDQKGTKVEPQKSQDFTSQDQANLLGRVADLFDIDQLDVVVGASYGGMVGQSFASLYPERIKKLVSICAADRPNVMASSLRAIQRKIVEKSTDSLEGLALARALSMTTYRSAEEFDERFEAGIEDETDRNNFWSYLSNHGKSFASAMSAQRFIALSRSIDSHQVDSDAIQASVQLIGFSSDQICSMKDLLDFKKRLGPKATLSIYPSKFGHDAFIKEVAKYKVALTKFLEE